MCGGTFPPFPRDKKKNNNYFFNLITTDRYKDGWITKCPPPQQHAHPFNYTGQIPAIAKLIPPQYCSFKIKLLRDVKMNK